MHILILKTIPSVFMQPMLFQVYNITQLVLEYFHKKNEYVNYTELAGDFFQTTLSWLTREGRALNPGKIKSSRTA